MPLRRPLILAVLLAMVATVPAAAADAPTDPPASARSVVSVEQNDTPLDGWGGWLIWSRRGPDGRFALVARDPGGSAVLLPVASSTAPIDASIGPGPDGRPLVVYARCAQQSATPPRGCDVFRIDPQTGAGGPVGVASSPNRDERFPSVWGTRIAFSLTTKTGSSRTAGVAVADLDGGAAPARPIAYGPRTERVAGAAVRTRGYAPQGIDLNGSRLAFSWHTILPGDRWRLVYVPGRGAARILLTAPTSARTVSEIGRPVLGGSHVVAPVLRTGGQGRSEIVQTSLSGTRRWTLKGAFTAEQTEAYGSALTAVARTTTSDLVVVRRLASDGLWSCTNPLVPAAQGCEILRYADPTPYWTRIRSSG